jgi:acyl carrier protein
MDNLTAKLTKCFAAVFPNLSSERIPAASAENVSEWDSIAQVNLLSIISEEFNIEIDFEEFEGATSFGQMLERVRQLRASA